MFFRKFILTLVVFHFFCSWLVADEIEDDNFTDWSDSQDIQEAEEDGNLSAAFASELEDLSLNPIDLNQSTQDELEELPDMTVPIAQQIIDSRKRLGPFHTPADLLTRGLMREDEYEKIKSMVTASPPESAQDLGGEITHQISINPEAENDKVNDLLGIPFNPQSQNSHLRIWNQARSVRFGAAFAESKDQHLQENWRGEIPKIVIAHGYEWKGGYFLYQKPLAVKPDTENHPFGFINQMVLGNYQLAFLKNLKKGTRGAFAGSESAGATREFRATSTGSSALKMRGVGIQTVHGKIQNALFYSRDKLPSKISVIKTSDKTGQEFVTSAVVQDTYEMENVGDALEWNIPDVARAGMFGIMSRGDPIYPKTRQPQIDSDVWGFQGNVLYGGVESRALFARSDRPVLTLKGTQERNFYHIKIARSLNPGSRINLSFKHVEPGFYTPVGNIFSGGNLWNYSCTYSQRLKSASLSTFLQQSQGKSRESQSVGARVSKPISAESIFFAGGSYSYTNESAVTAIAGADSIESDSYNLSLKLKMKSSDDLEHRWGGRFTYAQVNKSGSYRIAEKLTYQVRWQIHPRLNTHGEIAYSDKDLVQGATQTKQKIKIGLSYTPTHFLNFTFSWINTAYSKYQSVWVDDEKYIIENSGAQNNFNFKATCRW